MQAGSDHSRFKYAGDKWNGNGSEVKTINASRSDHSAHHTRREREELPAGYEFTFRFGCVKNRSGEYRKPRSIPDSCQLSIPLERINGIEKCLNNSDNWKCIGVRYHRANSGA